MKFLKVAFYGGFDRANGKIVRPNRENGWITFLNDRQLPKVQKYLDKTYSADTLSKHIDEDFWGKSEEISF